MPAYNLADLIMGAILATIILAAFLPVWFFVNVLLNPPKD